MKKFFIGLFAAVVIGLVAYGVARAHAKKAEKAVWYYYIHAEECYYTSGMVYPQFCCHWCCIEGNVCRLPALPQEGPDPIAD